MSTRYRQGVIVVAAVLSALTFGWPFIGAINGLFWSHLHHGGPRIDAISRVVDVALNSPEHRLTPNKELREGISRFPDPQPNCEQLAEARSNTAGDDLITASFNLNEALYRLRRDEYRSAVRKAAFDGITELPDFWIGTIDGCISGSVLAPVCTAYSVAKVDDALRLGERALTKSFIGANGRAERSWCLALGNTKGARDLIQLVPSK